jgi:tetratricopeptide (TPR) repeat protein
METWRVALIRYAAREGTGRRVGSGLLIDGSTILTADHVADGREYRVDFAGHVRAVTHVLRSGTGDVDLAVFTLSEPVAGVARLGFARVDRDHVGQISNCCAVGFPRWRTDGNLRRSAQVTGIIPTAEGLEPTANSGLRAGFLTLVTDRNPEFPAFPTGALRKTEDSPWSGMSGAVVVTGGLVVGVIRSHNLAAGGQSLTVTPITSISGLRVDLRRQFCDALGITDLDEIRMLSAVASRSTTAPLPRSPVRGLPRDLPDFTGRTQEIDYLVGRLSTATDGARVLEIHAIDGMAGIGKTSLAVHVGYRLQSRYSDALFLDLRAHTKGQQPLDPGDALETLLVMLGVPGGEIPARLDERIAKWRTELSGRRALVVLDNAASAAQVAPLLPGALGCLTIVTSRTRLRELEGVESISLDALPADDALELLSRIVGGGRVAAEPGPAAEVVLRCGYLPLAIRLVASWLRHHRAWTIANTVGRLSSALLPVAAAIELSYRDLDDDKQTMFRSLALYPGQMLTRETASALVDAPVEQAEALLDELYDRHLLEESRAGRFQLHDLVRDYARELARDTDPEPRRRAVIERLLGYCLDAVKRHEADRDYGWLDDETSELLACALYAVEHRVAGFAWELPKALAVILQVRGLYRQAGVLHMGALSAATAHGDKDAQAGLHIDLSIVERDAGRCDRAMLHAHESLRLYRETGNDRGQANAMAEMGVVFMETGDPRQGREYLEQALEKYSSQGSLIGVGNAALALGDLCIRIGDLDEARDYERMALASYTAAGSSHGQAVAHLGLANVSKLAGDMEDSRSNLESAARFASEGGIRTTEASAHLELGDLDEGTGDHDSAHHHWSLALDVYLKINDSDGLASVQRRLQAPDREARLDITGSGLNKYSQGNASDTARQG